MSNALTRKRTKPVPKQQSVPKEYKSWKMFLSTLSPHFVTKHVLQI